MNYDIDQIIDGKPDYEVLQWFASRAESGEQLTPDEDIPAKVFQVDFAYRNGFVDLLWSDHVHLVYEGLPALEACGFKTAIDATRDLQAVLDQYSFRELLKSTEEPLEELEEEPQEALLAEAAKLETKYSIVSREFSRGLLEAGFAYVQSNLEAYRQNRTG